MNLTKKQIGPRPDSLLARVAIACVVCALFVCAVDAAKALDIIEPESVEELRLQIKSTDVVLSWPSERRETFVILWRSNATVETPWLVLTNQMRGSTNAAWTAFHDSNALSRLMKPETKPNLADFYRVFVIPDFWFDLKEVTFGGGLKNLGEDFLPFYRGSGATDFLKPEITLLVDGEHFGMDENIERVNFGTGKMPRWNYSTGTWFKHQMLANGEHTLQLLTLLTLNNIVGDWSWKVTLSNAPVRIWVTNEISFAGFEPLIIGSNYTFIAQSAEPRVNWRMEVRDFRGRLLASQTGRTIDGNIRWTWDLRDTQGHLHDSLENDPHFFPTITTWALEKPKGGQRLIELGRKRPRNCWWNHRLGRTFVRNEPSMEERRQKFIYSDVDPLESQLFWRPYDYNKNPKRNSHISP